MLPIYNYKLEGMLDAPHRRNTTPAGGHADLMLLAGRLATLAGLRLIRAVCGCDRPARVRVVVPADDPPVPTGPVGACVVSLG